MKYLKVFILLFISLTLVVGCAPPKFIPREPPIVKFEKEPPYKIDLDSIIKPDKPLYIWMDKDFKVVPQKEAKYLVLTKKEFAKFTAQLEIKQTYKAIILRQEVLVNTKIEIINSLKEYLSLEQMKVKEYRDLWVDSENAYRLEKYNNDMNSLMTKGILSVISIGALIALIIAL
jgi:hypothetical protein